MQFCCAELQQLLEASKSSSQRSPETQRRVFYSVSNLCDSLSNSSTSELKDSRAVCLTLLKAILGDPALRPVLTAPLLCRLPECFAGILKGEAALLSDTLSFLTALLLSKNATDIVCLGAIKCLGGISLLLGRKVHNNFRSTIEALTVQLKSSDATLREASLQAISHVVQGTGVVTGKDKPHEKLVKLMIQLLPDNSPDVRARIGEILSVIGSNSGTFNTVPLSQLLNVAMKGLGDPCHRVRLAFAKSTGVLIALSIPSQTFSSSNTTPQKKKGGIAQAIASSRTGKTTAAFLKGLRKGKMPSFFTLPQALDYFSAQWSDAGLEKHIFRAGLLEALTTFLQATQHKHISNGDSISLVLRSLCTLVFHSSKNGSSRSYQKKNNCIAAVGAVLRRGLISCANGQQMLRIANAILETVEPAQVKGGMSRSEGTITAEAAGFLLREMHYLLLLIGESASSIFQRVVSVVNKRLGDMSHPVRHAAARCLHGICRACPLQATSLLKESANGLMVTHAELSALASRHVQTPPNNEHLAKCFARLDGNAAALQGVVAALPHCQHGVPQQELGVVLAVARSLVARQHDTALSIEANIACTRAGWGVVAALLSLGPHPVRQYLDSELLPMWQNALEWESDQSMPKNEVELLRRCKFFIFATGALSSFVHSCPELFHSNMYNDVAMTLVSGLTKATKLFTMGEEIITGKRKVSKPSKLQNSQQTRHLLRMVTTWLKTLVLESFAQLPPSLFESLHKELFVAAVNLFAGDNTCTTSLSLTILQADGFPLDMAQSTSKSNEPRVKWENYVASISFDAPSQNGAPISFLKLLELPRPTKLGVELAEISALRAVASRGVQKDSSGEESFHIYEPAPLDYSSSPLLSQRAVDAAIFLFTHLFVATSNEQKNV
eukprot:g6051.t1